jgi:ketosteroid isomerase-like protein
MSQDNVELHLRAFDAWNRRDLEAWLLLADPEIEIMPLNVEMEGGGAYRGHNGVRRFWDDYLAVFPDFKAEVDEVRDLGMSRSLARAFAATAPKATRRSSSRSGGPWRGATTGACGGGASVARPRPSRPPDVAASSRRLDAEAATGCWFSREGAVTKGAGLLLLLVQGSHVPPHQRGDRFAPLAIMAAGVESESESP